MQAKKIIDDFNELINIAKDAIKDISTARNESSHIHDLKYDELELRKDKYFLTFHGDVSCSRSCCSESVWEEIELYTLQQILDNREHYFNVILQAELEAERSAKEEKRLAEERELAELQAKKLAEIERVERETFLKLKDKYKDLT